MIASNGLRGLHGIPYDTPYQSAFTVQSNGALIQDSIGPAQLGFIARSIIAHNLTADWYYIPAAMAYVPPHTVAMVLPISGTQVAYAVPEVPTQYSVSGRVIGATMTLVYTALQLPYSEGYPPTSSGQGPIISGGPPSPLLTGLVAYWPLNETSGTRADSLGISPMTSVNNVGYNAGKIGNAAQFINGNSQYLSATDTPNISMGTGVLMTLVFWFYLDSFPAGGSFYGLVCKRASAGNREYQTYIEGNTHTFRAGVSPDGNGFSNIAEVPTVLTLNTWYMAYMEYSGFTVGASLNAGAGYSVSYSGDIFDGTSPLTLGYMQEVGVYMDGRIEEVGIWKRRLTPPELSQLYNSGNGRTYPFIGT